MGREPDFPKEALGTHRGSEVGVEDLEGYRPVVLAVLREVHRGHAPPPQFAGQHVLVPQGICEGGGRRSQVPPWEGVSSNLRAWTASRYGVPPLVACGIPGGADAR
jgi:hypothetical protein